MRTPGKMIRAVAFAAMRDGKKLPTNDRIAQVLGCNESTVRRTLGLMEAAGEIHVVNDGRRRRVHVAPDTDAR